MPHPQLQKALATALVCAAQVGLAACPVGWEMAGDRSLGSEADAPTVQLCLDATPTASGAAGTVEVTVARQGRQLSQLRLPIDVEGELREIRFDGAHYALGDKLPAVPLLLESRLRGATFDQYSTELWLLRFDGQKLHRVLAEPVSWETWGTHCEPDCIDTTRTRTLVIIAPEKSQGLHDLRLRTRGRVIAHGEDERHAKAVDTTVRFTFNGQQYERALR